MDLYDHLAEKFTADVQFETVVAYLHCQIDSLRTDLPTNSRSKVRDNKGLTAQLVADLTRHRPTASYEIFRIMDEVTFTDEESVIPSLSLKAALKKAFPYAEDEKI